MVESLDTEDAGPSGGADVSRESGEMLKHMHKRGAVVSSSTGQRPSWAELTAGEGPVKAEVSGRAFAPILVSCSGSDEGDSSSDQQGGPAEGVLQQHNSVTSTLDGMDGANYSSFTSSEAVPARMISEAEVQAGCFKTGVRYCLETWPNSFILRVRVPFAAMSATPAFFVRSGGCFILQWRRQQCRAAAACMNWSPRRFWAQHNRPYLAQHKRLPAPSVLYMYVLTKATTYTQKTHIQS